MNDQTIPADDLRRFIARYRAVANDRGSILLDELEALLPAPPRPTLADMTHGERRECRWMQCDVIDWRERPVIVPIHHNDGTAMVMCEDGTTDTLDTRQITPRPDLPRLEWPGTEKPAPAPALPGGWRLADHEKRGRVIVTNDTPNTAGHVCFVLPATDPLGYDWLFCDPAELTYLDTDQETDTTTGPSTLAVGTVIESADDPRLATLPTGSALLDCDGEAVAKRGEVWVGDGYIPTPEEGGEFGPWTVLHIPKEADQ